MLYTNADSLKIDGASIAEPLDLSDKDHGTKFIFGGDSW